MGTCYICGKQHVNYRRTVTVGNSTRYSISSKGRSSTSYGLYYGTRTVCAKCALDIDYSNQKNKINIYSGISIVAFFLVFILPFIGMLLDTDSWEHTYTKIMCVCSAIVLILDIIFLVKGIKEAKKRADIWFQENKNQYVDEIDIQIMMQQKLLEERKQIENQKNNSRLEHLEQQLQESSSIFNERLNQEISVITNKQELLNTQLHSVEETEEKLSAAIKILEDFEKEVQKNLKTVNKLCDDYIKQCKSLVWDKKLLPSILENIEANRAHKINYLNALISSIKENENNALKKIVDLKK
jgi:uncharacterized protein (DUF983 family)